MSKVKENVDVEEEEDGNFICEVMGYRVLGSSNQYTLLGPKKDKKSKTFPLIGYHRTFSDALDDVREQMMRLRLVGSGTLDKAIESLNQFNKEWNKAIAPLKNLEEDLIWGKDNLHKHG